MAIACFRLVTFCPEPLSSVPRFLRRIADATVFDAALPYFAIATPKHLAVQRVCRNGLGAMREALAERTAVEGSAMFDSESGRRRAV